MIKISPSLFACDFSQIKEEVKKVEDAGVEYLHIDVMDGHFVPNLSLGPDIIKSARPHSKLVFDTHLMISDPKKYAEAFVKAGSDIITFHYEAVEDPEDLIDYIHSLGCKASVSIKPKTDYRVLEPFMEKLDMVLIMTVEPGFGGQSFIMDTVKSIKGVRELIDKTGKDIDLEVDGGITPENVHIAIEAGANVIVAGSAIFRAKDIAAAVKAFKEAGSK
ncbi:MAG: ribulose-phosphate 3-epimerase [Ruminococcaceae bacterium]|nr:ribulose-phosphate 3-epimerase [Oscillospiraceae bacterium]